MCISSYECLKSLLEAGFSPDSLFDCVGFTSHIPHLPELETALSYAVSKQNDENIAILLAAGANCNPPVDRAFHPILRGLIIINYFILLFIYFLNSLTYRFSL